ncbi:MAG: FtsH protease activity modulator HflK [Rhodocyclaceae bacterium]|nr:FtsH protease activity modulator HflK [Rhodocyclaceae bacterium]
MSQNDPQWGRRNNSGGEPPDLDEVLQRFFTPLRRFFGGGKGPSVGKGPGGLGIALIFGVVVVVWAASGFYIVDESARGVVTRFGRYAETTTPGLRWHLPYPVEQVEVVNISQVRTLELGYRGNVRSKVLKESLMLTDDENIVDLQFAVQYVLKSPEDFIFTNRNPEESVLQAAETAIRETVGKSKMDFVIYEGREQVARDAQALMQQILDRYKTGVSISRVTMQSAQPPEQVQAAFDDAVKAGQDRERQKNEGEAYANDVVPKARGMASRLLEEAQGYQNSVIAKAEGDASRFSALLAEYRKAPAVTRDRLYIETMQQVYANTTKVLVDQKPGGGNLLYLPLDKLIAASAAGGSLPADATRVPAEAAAPGRPAPADDRSRDGLRSRDREVRP